MKASELRIGNLYDQFGNLHKVSWSTLKDLESAPESQLWCKPIPLTEEWLVKAGFELMSRDEEPVFELRIHPLGEHIVVYPESGVYQIFKRNSWFSLNREIKYVHQLQNLYHTLTGEELIFEPCQSSTTK